MQVCGNGFSFSTKLHLGSEKMELVVADLSPLKAERANERDKRTDIPHLKKNTTISSPFLNL